MARPVSEDPRTHQVNLKFRAGEMDRLEELSGEHASVSDFVRSLVDRVLDEADGFSKLAEGSAVLVPRITLDRLKRSADSMADFVAELDELNRDDVHIARPLRAVLRRAAT
jgi:predicted CopG family antitoxin